MRAGASCLLASWQEATRGGKKMKEKSLTRAVRVGRRCAGRGDGAGLARGGGFQGL